MTVSKTFRETRVMWPLTARFEREFDRGSKNKDRFFGAGIFARWI